MFFFLKNAEDFIASKREKKTGDDIFVLLQKILKNTKSVNLELTKMRLKKKTEKWAKRVGKCFFFFFVFCVCIFWKDCSIPSPFFFIFFLKKGYKGYKIYKGYKGYKGYEEDEFQAKMKPVDLFFFNQKKTNSDSP